MLKEGDKFKVIGGETHFFNLGEIVVYTGQEIEPLSKLAKEPVYSFYSLKQKFHQALCLSWVEPIDLTKNGG